MSKEIYLNTRFKVTERLLSTPRRTYQISKIEKTEVRRALLPIFLPFIIILPIFSFRFSPWLYWYEELSLFAVSLLLSIIGILFGTLNIQSKAVNETAAIGLIKTLKEVRVAVDSAIDARDRAIENLYMRER